MVIKIKIMLIVLFKECTDLLKLLALEGILSTMFLQRRAMCENKQNSQQETIGMLLLLFSIPSPWHRKLYEIHWIYGLKGNPQRDCIIVFMHTLEYPLFVWVKSIVRLAYVSGSLFVLEFKREFHSDKRVSSVRAPPHLKTQLSSNPRNRSVPCC